MWSLGVFFIRHTFRQPLSSTSTWSEIFAVLCEREFWGGGVTVARALVWSLHPVVKVQVRLFASPFPGTCRSSK